MPRFRALDPLLLRIATNPAEDPTASRHAVRLDAGFRLYVRGRDRRPPARVGYGAMRFGLPERGCRATVRACAAPGSRREPVTYSRRPPSEGAPDAAVSRTEWGGELSRHRLSRKSRYIAWATAGAVVVAGAGIAAQTSMAATAWPAQKTYTGRAFDACTAPSLSAMKAWHTGYYGAAAVYIGGKNRGCAQPNLTRSWVKSVNATGWKLIPLYVGAQPPCQKSANRERFTSATAASVGASNAKDAIAKASALGMKAAAPSTWTWSRTASPTRRATTLS